MTISAMDATRPERPSLVLAWTSVKTRFGPVHIAYSGACPHFVSLGSADAFCDWVRSVSKGCTLRAELAPPYDLQGALRCLRDPRRSYDGPLALAAQTPFQRQVLAAARAIPCGETRSYGELAARIAHPRAARAVGTALGHNPLPLLIPCHRVVAAGSRLGQYSDGGQEMKRRLLAYEGVDVARLR